MAGIITQKASSNGITPWINVDHVGRGGRIYTIVVDYCSEANASLCVDVEFTVSKDHSNAVAIGHHILKDLTGSCASDLKVPITGARMNVTNYKQGTVTLTLLQHRE